MDESPISLLVELLIPANIINSINLFSSALNPDTPKCFFFELNQQIILSVSGFSKKIPCLHKWYQNLWSLSHIPLKHAVAECQRVEGHDSRGVPLWHVWVLPANTDTDVNPPHIDVQRSGGFWVTAPLRHSWFHPSGIFKINNLCFFLSLKIGVLNKTNPQCWTDISHESSVVCLVNLFLLLSIFLSSLNLHFLLHLQ